MSSERGDFTRPFEGPDTVLEDEESRGSVSVGSTPGLLEGPITTADLVDLTGDDFCRVVMKSGSVSRVCGNKKKDCTRKFHTTIVQDPIRRGGAAFYVAYGSSSGVLDGRLNEPTFSAEDVALLRSQELHEQAAALSDIQRAETSFHVDFDPMVQAIPPATSDEGTGTGSWSNLTGTPPSPPSAAPVPTSAPAPAPARTVHEPNEMDPQEPGEKDPFWIGLENTTTFDRTCLQDEEKARFLSTVGWQVRRLFEHEQAARRWVSEARPASRPPTTQPPFHAPASAPFQVPLFLGVKPRGLTMGPPRTCLFLALLQPSTGWNIPRTGNGLWLSPEPTRTSLRKQDWC